MNNASRSKILTRWWWNSRGELRSMWNRCATSGARRAIAYHSVGWGKNLLVTGAVKIIELPCVVRRSSYQLHARISTWVGHLAENRFFTRSNGAVEEQDARFAKRSEFLEAKWAGPCGQNNIIFVKEADPVEQDNTMAAFKDLQIDKLSVSSKGCRMTLTPTIRLMRSRKLV